MPTDEERESALAYELKQWEKLGVNPAQWNHPEGMLGLVVRFEVLDKLLTDAGLISGEDKEALYMETIVERLRYIRNELEPQIREAKLAAIRNGNLGRN